VPCLAHVINLACQSLLGKGGISSEAPQEAESMDVEDDDDAEGFIRISIGDEEFDDACESDDNETPTKRALDKLRKGIVKIR
jgi:hypothetical protein